MSPLSVTIQVPYAENERQFLQQAVEAAVRAFRRINGKPGDGFGEMSSTRATQDEPTAPLDLVS
jgi:hypothetical protein